MAVSPELAVEGAERVLTVPALAFVEDLTRRFRPRIDELLARRRATQERFNVGGRPDFLAETSDVRHRDWTVGSIPTDLQDRRVEITGPADRKMIIKEDRRVYANATIRLRRHSRPRRLWHGVPERTGPIRRSPDLDDAPRRPRPHAGSRLDEGRG